MTSSSSFAEWKYVPKGWIAPEAGYFGSEQDGRDTLVTIQTYKEQSKAWETAFETQAAENKKFQGQINERIALLEQVLNEEREAWKKSLIRAKAPGWGVFAGGGINPHGRADLAIGIGLVWRF